MTGRDPVLQPLFDAEMDVTDIARWGRVLIAMGASHNDISPGAAYVVGQALEALGNRVERRWEEALSIAREVGRGR